MVSNRRAQHGFTLIELIMVIVILSIISVVLGRFLTQSYQTVVTAQNINEADYAGFVALERMTDDIHAIRSYSDISTISSSQLVFTNASGTSITYQLSGTNLQRNSVNLASGVQSLAFAYQDASYATTATAANVRYIAITVSLVQNTITTSFSTVVGLRNS